MKYKDMKYLTMLVIILGLVGCGSSSKGPDAMEKWAEFNNSRVGGYHVDRMSYLANNTRRLSDGSETIARQTEEDIEKLREEATDLTGNSYCFPNKDPAGNETNICRYIDNTKSSFEELIDKSLEESVSINSVNSRCSFFIGTIESTNCSYEP